MPEPSNTPVRDSELHRRLFDADPQVRRHALQLAAESRDAWVLRTLLIAAAGADGPTTRQVTEALARRGTALHPLLLLELEGPVARVRMLALQLLGDSADLTILPRILPCLFDHGVDVREAARRAVATITERALHAFRESGTPPAGLTEAFRALGKTARTNDTSARKSTLTALLHLALISSDRFWSTYHGLPPRAVQHVHLEFLSAGASWALKTLYRGFLIGHEEVEQRMAGVLTRHLPNDDINRHLQQIGELDDEELGRLALALETHGLLPVYLDALPHIKPDSRQTLLDMVEYLDLGRYTRFLERCVELDDVRLRTRALRLLGGEAPAATAQRAVRMLRSDDIHEVLVALDLVAKQGQQQSLQQMKPLLSHPSSLVRQATARGMFQVTKGILLERFNDLPEPARASVVASLEKLNPAIFDDLLRDWEENPQEEHRIVLARLLSCLGHREEMEPLLDRLIVGAGTRLRATLARLFGSLANPVRRLQRLVPLLYDPDHRVRANAIDELPAPVPDSVVERLQELARSEHHRERANATRLLISLGHTEYEITLVRMIEDPNPALRSSGVWTLGELGLEHLRDALHDRLTDREPLVRAHAIRALGKCAPREEIMPLESFLKDPARDVRIAARDVLRKRLRLAFTVEE